MYPLGARKRQGYYHASMGEWFKRWFGHSANLVQILGWVTPALTFSAVVGVIVAVWSGAFEWVQKPTVYIPAFVFAYSLWIYAALAVISGTKRTRTVRIAHDYASSFIPEGTQLTLGKFPPDHPTHPNDAAFMFVFNFRNVGAGPARMRIDEFRVVINGMTGEELGEHREITFARMGLKGLRTVVKRDAGKPNYMGIAVFRLLYGAPEGNFLRKYTYRLKINVSVDEQSGNALYSDEIVEETDEPYVTR
jgi:hypothetical protein